MAITSLGETSNNRVVVWFSCGAASAVAAYLAIQKYGDRAVIVNCDTLSSEHPDNLRFFYDVEVWLKRSIACIKSVKYDTVDDVFEARKYLGGIAGAPCTAELKKVPRFVFQQPDDIHIFGLTADEGKRIATFTKNHPDLQFDWILQDQGITKEHCFHILKDVGIALPEMYKLGFANNNCIGCVKATSPHYWRLIRKHFPEAFTRRSEQSRRFGARLVRINGVRHFLDELPEDAQISLWDAIEPVVEDISCGPQCGPQYDVEAVVEV